MLVPGPHIPGDANDDDDDDADEDNNVVGDGVETGADDKCQN